MDISVVICIYNSSIEKLKKTIYSVVCQKDVEFEIVLADDGSSIDITEQIENIFEKYKFSNYCIIRSVENIGTVRNYYSAIQQAKGKYIYGTSPGDMLYDDNTLKEFFCFSENNNAKCVFGDAVCYCIEEDQPKLLKMVNFPSSPNVFEASYNKVWGKLAILQGHKICGATFFREKKSFIQHMQRIMDTTKYVEDATTTMSYVLSEERVLYFSRKIVWYECGVGISTCAENKWQEIIKSEIIDTKEKLFAEYTEDKIVKFFIVKNKCGNKVINNIKRICKHPILSIYCIILRMKKKVYTSTLQSDMDKLKRFWEI